ncbi:PIR Superfamily Protein, partial [Plasmodium ovale curtisi]
NEYEKDLPANKFATELNEKNKSDIYYESALFNDIMPSAEKETKFIGVMLIKNFLIFKEKKKEWNKRCNDLNHWLDLKKLEHSKSLPDKHIQEWQLVEELWIRTNKDRVPETGCERNPSNEKLPNMVKRYELEHFCENRDFLKNKCQEIHTKKHEDKYCKNLSIYVDQEYSKFLTKEKCIPDKNSNPYNPFYISDECSLHDMSKTFPRYEFNNDNISEIYEGRTAITPCSQNKDLLQNLGSEEASASLTFESAEIQSPSLRTNNVLYGSLPILGVFPFLFYLYRFTSFGSLLRARIMKTDMIKRDIDELGSYTLSDDTSKIIDTNFDSEQYYLSYEPT